MDCGGHSTAYWVIPPVAARDDASPYSADDYAKYFKDKIDSVRTDIAA